jgi:NADH-quinone oxidoreductase subunit C
MTPEHLLETLQKQFPDCDVALQKGQSGDAYFVVKPSDLLAVLTYLKAELRFNYLATLSGVDYGGDLGTTYVIRSLATKDEIIVKTLAPRSNPAIPSVASLYASANWFERESYDLLGIQYVGHPDMRRLMMPEDWEGHPLRKDYVYPLEYHGIPCERPDSHELLDAPKQESTEGKQS